jgi:molecular chaperone HscB
MHGSSTTTVNTHAPALVLLQRCFAIDEQDLHRTYKELMAKAHPDRQGHLSLAKQEEAADHASDLTDAYAVLRSPHTRATHLLALRGEPLTEETSGDVLGPGFLMHVLETREELEDSGVDLERLRTMRDANQRDIRELLTQLRSAFDEVGDLKLARTLTAQLQYLQRIEEEIHAKTPVA